MRVILLLVMLAALAAPSGSRDAESGVDHDGLPSTGPALTALGGERLSQGDVTGALRVFEKATRLFPAVSLAWYNVAVAYGHAGLLQHAEDAYRRSAELTSGGERSDVLRSVANAQVRQGKHFEAWRTFQRAICGEDANMSEQLLTDAAKAAMAIKDYAAARGTLRLCSRLHRLSHRAHISLAHVHMTTNHHAEAVSELLHAARLVGARGDQFKALVAEGAGYRVALDQHHNLGDAVEVVCTLQLSLQRSALWSVVDRDAVYSRFIKQILLDDPRQVSRCSNSAHGLEIGLSPQHIRRLADDDARRVFQDVGELRTHFIARLRGPGEARRSDRLRIAYLSGTGFQSFTTTAHFIVGILEAHDAARIDARCLAFLPDDASPVRRRLGRVCAMEEMADKNNRQVAEHLNAQQVQVLVDLTGLTLGPRLHILASRPCPVQIHWHGYPGTLGAAGGGQEGGRVGGIVDWYAGDRVSTPPELRQHFSESLMTLPLPYLANSLPVSAHGQHAEGAADFPAPTHAAGAAAAQPPSREVLFTGRVQPGDVVLAVFSQAFKIDEPILRAWVSILLLVPHAKLWVLRHNTRSEAALRSAISRLASLPPPSSDLSGPVWTQPSTAQQRQGLQERVLFTELLDRSVEFESKALADILLDTRLFGCHTTGVEGLWAGLPLLSAPGESLPSRVAASIALAAGSQVTVVRNLEEYVALTVALVRGGGLQRVKANVLRGRPASKWGSSGEKVHGIWKINDFTRGWEGALRMAWDAWDSNEDQLMWFPHMIVAERD